MRFNLLVCFLVFVSCQTKEYKEKEKTIVSYDSLRIVLDSVDYYDQYFYNSDLKGKTTYSKAELLVIERVEKRQIQNLDIVTTILDKYGWLSKEEVGQTASGALWLTIQHSDLATQLKYFPLLKEAVKNDKADPTDVAMLEDRMALKQGKKQIYGSQLPPHPITKKSTVWAIENPEKVDERRAKVGLEPMSEYVVFWKINWDLQEHLEYTKELEVKGLMDFYKEEK